MRKYVLFLSGILTLSFSLGFVAETPSLGTGTSKLMRIGYVDVRKVFDSCTATQQATLSLKKEIESKRAELAKEEELITALQKELHEKEIVLSETEKKKREKEIEEKISLLQKKAEIAQQEMVKKERQLTESIIKLIQGIITEIAKEKDFNLILEKDSILYGENVVDLTDIVIERVNKKEGL